MFWGTGQGIVINADIAISIGNTELLGIEIRTAIASFETTAQYGLAFPNGTDMRRVEQASGREPLEDEIGLGIKASHGGSRTSHSNPPVVESQGSGTLSKTDRSNADNENAEGQNSKMALRPLPCLSSSESLKSPP